MRKSKFWKSLKAVLRKKNKTQPWDTGPKMVLTRELFERAAEPIKTEKLSWNTRKKARKG